jgi:hypothetical protein
VFDDFHAAPLALFDALDGPRAPWHPPRGDGEGPYPLRHETVSANGPYNVPE